MKNPYTKPGVLQRYDIGNIIATRLNIRQREGQLIAREIARALCRVVAEHGHLELRGFGVLYTKMYPGSSFNVPGREANDYLRIHFRPGRRLKRVLAQGLKDNARGVLKDVSPSSKDNHGENQPEMSGGGASE